MLRALVWIVAFVSLLGAGLGGAPAPATRSLALAQIGAAINTSGSGARSAATWRVAAPRLGLIADRVDVEPQLHGESADVAQVMRGSALAALPPLVAGPGKSDSCVVLAADVLHGSAAFIQRCGPSARAPPT